jgi:hypothetical protein
MAVGVPLSTRRSQVPTKNKPCLIRDLNPGPLGSKSGLLPKKGKEFRWVSNTLLPTDPFIF